MRGNIYKHCNTLVGYHGRQSNHSEYSYINAFISWYLSESQDFDQTLFDKLFKKFIDFFENDFVELNKKCDLFNFNSELEEIEFSDTVKIIKTVSLPDRSLLNGYEAFSKSHFYILQTHKIKKIIKPSCAMSNGVLGEEISESELFQKFSNSVNTNFDRVIKAIRLLQHTACYRDHKVKEYGSDFFGRLGTSLGSSFLTNTSIGKECLITKDNVDELKTIWCNLDSDDNDIRLDISSDRLFSSLERVNKIDILIDLFIGLETLYLPDENSELTFRLSLRSSKLLEINPTGQKNEFDFIKKMYSKRSSLVHGKKVNLEDEELLKLENILRTSIKKYIKDSTLFSKENLNKILF